MNKLMNIFKGIAAAAFLWLAGSGLAAAAPVGLDIQFETSPLFSEAAFAPGDSVVRWIKVLNGTGQPQAIAAKVESLSDEGGLSGQFEVVIRKEGETLYSQTLSAFASAGEVFLSNLADGQQHQYDFSVTFRPESGNEYQNKALSFDFSIGTQQGESQGGGGGSGGGGGGGFNLCGNGFKDGAEQCDLGSQNGSCPSACSSACYINECGQVAGTSTPGGLPYSAPEGPSGEIASGLFLFSGQNSGSPSGGSGQQGEGGQVLGAAVSEAQAQSEPVLAEQASACVPYPWWELGYLAYALLLLGAYRLARKMGAWRGYLLPVILLAGALIWWRLEPCPDGFWLWPLAAVIYFAAITGWHIMSQQPPSRPDQPARSGV